MKKTLSLFIVAVLAQWAAVAGERTIVSLRDFSGTELKYAGLELTMPTTLHIRALGGGGNYSWNNKDDQMFAYGWIMNADTRDVVWSMNPGNTYRTNNDREFDGNVKLEPGSYEVYFTAYAFAQHTTFSHISINVDHRNTPLFGSSSHDRRGFFNWFKDFWADDISKDFSKRSPNWGIDLLADESVASSIHSFTPPKTSPHTLARAIGAGDNECLRIAFELTEPTSLHLYMLGERTSDREMADWGWIVNLADRRHVWDMSNQSLMPAGGADKNKKFDGEVPLEKGRYLLYYVTDGSHSMADWNAAPPVDPLNYGVTISVRDPRDAQRFHQFQYDDYQNVIVSLVRMGNDEHRSQGFTLQQDADVRVYAFGERSNSRSTMADYGQILDARTRAKVWTMDVDRTSYAGGTSKNRYIDEIIHLPKGSYIVTYNTDDSHAYHEWNDDPPFDPEHYGITVMGVGEHFSSSIVSRYAEQRDKNIIAQIVRVGNDENREENFSLDRATRVRIYAIGEGQGREMFDYGWIEDARTGNIVWEMTYPMTFHAGGGRKNRMVNTTILLDRGQYKLHFRSDDSHSYGDWNVDPPEDQEYWGITLYRDEGPGVIPAPAAETMPDAPPAIPPVPTPRPPRR